MTVTVKSREEGFTLLEVLVALAILGSVVAAIFSVVSNNRLSQTRADMRWRMAFLADALVQGVGLETPLAPGRWEGSREGFSWNLDVTPYMAGRGKGRSTQLHEIRVKVSSQAYGSESITLATLRLSERHP